MPRDPDKPRGRTSAYAFFVRHTRDERKRKHPDETVVFGEFSKECSELWKNLDDKQKQYFQKMADQDKVRYAEEMENYHPREDGAVGGGRKRQKRVKDPNAPKRPLSGFFWFCNDERPKVKEAMPNASVGEIAKEMGRRWGEFTNAQKGPYEEMAARDKARYERELEQYQAK